MALQALNVTVVGDLFQEGKARMWDEVVPQGAAPTPLVKFQYYRVRRAMRELLGADMAEPPEVAPLTLILQAESPAKLVSRVYGVVQA